LKFFLPDWEDRLDPDFDFIKDEYSDGHKKNPYEHDSYAHQLFEKPPYDGVLVSLAIFQKKISLGNNGSKFLIRGQDTIRKFLKIPEGSNLEIMGDCGAFNYVKEKEPPKPFYTIENVTNLYDKLGFDYGVSVDHLVVDYFFIKNPKTGRREKKALSRKEKDKRIEITLKNAAKFLKLHEREKYSFIPVGVAQGYDTDTYKDSFKSLVDMGYTYIAIGGLVQYKTEIILNILDAIQPFIDGINVHLFGVLRPDYLLNFEKLGVTSFDSASYLRKAWLRSEKNYLSTNGNWYSAIRVPQSKNPRIIKNADLNGFSKKDIEKMEKKALNALFEYDKGNIGLENTLKTVLKYDELLLRISNDGDKLTSRYRRTLLEKPWKTCNCPMCKNTGINIIIFRGTNRNKRRGFHNLHAFRNGKINSQSCLDLRKNANSTEDNALCIIPCGSKKIWDKKRNAGPTKAKDVYIGVFSNKCQEYAEKAYPESWCILSAKYGFLFPDDIIPRSYNVSFNDKKSNPITLDELSGQIKEKSLDKYDEIVVLGGKNYKEVIETVFPKKEIINPLSGCKGMGYMIGKLNSLIKEVL